jgi:hypothetical protein
LTESSIFPESYSILSNARVPWDMMALESKEKILGKDDYNSIVIGIFLLGAM